MGTQCSWRLPVQVCNIMEEKGHCSGGGKIAGARCSSDGGCGHVVGQWGGCGCGVQRWGEGHRFTVSFGASQACCAVVKQSVCGVCGLGGPWVFLVGSAGCVIPPDTTAHCL